MVSSNSPPPRSRLGEMCLLFPFMLTCTLLVRGASLAEKGIKGLLLTQLLHLITRHTTSGTQPAGTPLHFTKLTFCLDGVQFLSM